MEPTGVPLDHRRSTSGHRSGKRDLIVNVFLRQEGRLSADDLVDLIRREDHQISRATVYRTLQWMAEAGMARKVDLGRGRTRFEHSYRHPRLFHLICKRCDTSEEFLSSDVETALEEVAAARGFTPRQSVVQMYGECDACRTGRRAAVAPVASERVFARDALRIAMATERSGLEFYSRAARFTREPRGRRVFQQLARAEREHLRAFESRYERLLADDPGLESRPTFLFFRGAANGLFAAGAEELKADVDGRLALAIGIRCERGSHRFFKRYGERLSDPDGRRIFLDLADEERRHLELLIREQRALAVRRGRRRGTART